MNRRSQQFYQCAQAGFTLLEVMVAMVVLTLIVTSAFGALRLGERSWEAAMTRASETETLRTVASVLQRQLNQLLPLSWLEKTETTIAFDGSEDQLRFIAPAPQHHGSTGLFEYTLIAEADNNRTRLVLYYRLHDPDMNGFQLDADDSQRVLLVDSLKSASFAYFGAPARDEAPRWHVEWAMDEETFPQMVQVSLVGDNQRRWPELLLALPAEMTQ